MNQNDSSSESRWYRKTPVQVAIVAGVIAGVFGTLNVLIPIWTDNTDGDPTDKAKGEKPIVLIKEKEVLVNSKAVFDDGQLSIHLEQVENNADAVQVFIHGPNGTEKEWIQNGLGPPTEFAFDDETYLIHILSMIPSNGRVEKVNLTIAKKR